MVSFHVKFVQSKQTDKRTDRRTMIKQYAPYLSIRGHKKPTYHTILSFNSLERPGSVFNNHITEHVL